MTGDYLVIKSKWIFDINLEDIFSYNWTDCGIVVVKSVLGHDTGGKWQKLNRRDWEAGENLFWRLNLTFRRPTEDFRLDKSLIKLNWLHLSGDWGVALRAVECEARGQPLPRRREQSFVRCRPQPSQIPAQEGAEQSQEEDWKREEEFWSFIFLSICLFGVFNERWGSFCTSASSSSYCSWPGKTSWR